MKKIGGLLAVCITASLTLSGCGLYDIADLFSGLGKGSAQLYVNEELQMPVDGKDTILPGAAWLDTDGNSIQAHGGQIQLMSVPDGNGGKTEKYVWVGEDKSSGHFGNDVAVYTSDDLYHWEFQGDVLRAVESRKQLEEDSYFQELYQDYSQEELDEVYNCINKNTVIERPKMRVCWNWQTGTFEGRVSLTYGFKSRLPHQRLSSKFVGYLFCELCANI